MKPADLDQQVTIERATRTSDGRGGYTTVWAAVTTIGNNGVLFAHVKARSGSEAERAERLDATQVYDVTVWAHEVTDLRVTDRVSWEGTVMQIRAMPPAQRANFRTLTCQAGVAT